MNAAEWCLPLAGIAVVNVQDDGGSFAVEQIMNHFSGVRLCAAKRFFTHVKMGTVAATWLFP